MLREAWRTISEARAIIAPHGAGLSNLFVARPGTSVYELLQEGRMQVCYLVLAQEMALNYTGTIQTTEMDAKGNWHFQANINDIVEWLRPLL